MNLIPARVFEDYPFLLDLPLSDVENNVADPADMSLPGNKFLKFFFFFYSKRNYMSFQYSMVMALEILI